MYRNDLRRQIARNVRTKKRLDADRILKGIKGSIARFPDWDPQLYEDMTAILGHASYLTIERDHSGAEPQDWFFFQLIPRKSAGEHFSACFDMHTGEFVGIEWIWFTEEKINRTGCVYSYIRKTATKNERENAEKQIRSAFNSFVRKATRLGYLQ